MAGNGDHNMYVKSVDDHMPITVIILKGKYLKRTFVENMKNIIMFLYD